MTEIEAPRVSLLVLCYRFPHPTRAVQAVLDGLDGLSGLSGLSSAAVEVRLLLNGASTEVLDDVAARAFEAEVIESPVNLGFAAGMNRLAAEARGELLALLNDDTVAQPGWLDQLVATADAKPEIGAVSSRVRFPDGRLQEAGGGIGENGEPFQAGLDKPDDDDNLHHPRIVTYGSASALLIRRAAFEQVGGFDERFFPAYYEDVDLALRLADAGWPTWYEPATLVVHESGASTVASERSVMARYNHEVYVSLWSKRFPALSGSPSAPAHRLEQPSSEFAVRWEQYANQVAVWLEEGKRSLDAEKARVTEANERFNELGAEHHSSIAHIKYADERIADLENEAVGLRKQLNTQQALIAEQEELLAIQRVQLQTFGHKLERKIRAKAAQLRH